VIQQLQSALPVEVWDAEAPANDLIAMSSISVVQQRFENGHVILSLKLRSSTR
jgi:hypothetical protein